jgi:hypothetical protein
MKHIYEMTLTELEELLYLLEKNKELFEVFQYFNDIENIKILIKRLKK